MDDLTTEQKAEIFLKAFESFLNDALDVADNEEEDNDAECHKD